MNLKLLTIIFLFSLSSSIILAQEVGFFEYDWITAIDTTWGEGLATTEKLALFDTVWTLIDEKYACFYNLEINWDSLRAFYRPEIEQGVSRGRFAAIMNHLGLRLKDSHTGFYDSFVNVNYKPNPKIPLIYTGNWGLDRHFGAGLSPLPDSSLLVYVAAPDHPLDLEPGDVILGYEGIPWKRLYRILLEMEFPIGYPGHWGANDKSYTHSWLTGAGRNWHLFNTIDIVKYSSNDTIHLSTNLLLDKEFDISYSDQLPVPGVPFHDEVNHYNISSGVIDDKNIGYIYVWSWSRNNPSQNFYNALDSLINIYNVDGLILDMRANSGGYVNDSNKGLDLLFRSSPSILGSSVRSNPLNHFQMNPSIRYILESDSSTYYDKPIAVLTGPLAMSAADFICYRLKEHPNTKFFGKTTSTSFSSYEMLNYLFLGWSIRYANTNGYCEQEPEKYLTHLEFPVDYEIHFLPEDVSNGTDTIVKEAIKWIESEINTLVKHEGQFVGNYSLYQNYPNPFNSMSTITFSLGEKDYVSLKVYNILGQEASTLIAETLPPGIYDIKINSNKLSSGLYFYHMNTKKFNSQKKFIVIK